MVRVKLTDLLVVPREALDDGVDSVKESNASGLVDKLTAFRINVNPLKSSAIAAGKSGKSGQNPKMKSKFENFKLLMRIKFV